MLGVLLAKGLADFTFGGAFLWYLIKYLICGVVAVCAVMLGINLRKKKNEEQKGEE